MEFHKTGILALAIGSLVLPSCGKKVTERDAAYKTNSGTLVEADLKPGYYPSSMLPHIEVVKLPKFLQTVTVQATEGSPVNIRTKERARVYGNYDIMFELDSKDPNFKNIYAELKADEIDDLKPYIQQLAVPAIINVYKNVTSASGDALLKEQQGPESGAAELVSLDDHLKTGEGIATELQAILDKAGYTYIKVKKVIPSGVGLSPEANKQLEEIVSERRKLELQKVQIQVADSAVELTRKQTAVTAVAFQELEKGGVPANQRLGAYYLQLMQAEGKLGAPFVPGPVPGTGVGAAPASNSGK